ncbi:ankyrin repeat domain-containing protein [Alkalispirochaeta sphaeroplastigenens]|nr:ankyrin repeat domain-containing protein [Alkalispirochaeta sphaeroplastigenens]
MKIVMLAPPSEETLAGELCAELARESFQTERAFLGKEGIRTLTTSLNEATHAVVLMQEDCLLSKDYYYALGFFCGRDVPWIIYSSANLELPDYLSDQTCISAVPALIEFFTEERARWTAQRDRQRAREELTNLGYALTDQALADCVSEGVLVAVERYIQGGFSPDARDNKGVPLLCCAVRNRHTGMVQFLVSHGADVNAVSEDRGNTPIMDAAADGNSELTGLLLHAGAALDGQSKNGQTALVLAVGQGAEKTAELLLMGGADPHIKDQLGMSARKYAELFRLELVLDLIDARESEARNGTGEEARETEADLPDEEDP